MATDSDRNRRTETDREDGGIDTRRATAAVAGGVLIVRGLGRRSLRGVGMVLAGGWLVYRALGDRLDVDRAIPGRGRSPETADAPSVSRSITVGRPADELFDLWRDPDEFSRIVGHFAEVTSEDGDRFHWTVHGPRGRDISWETRIVEEEPGEVVRWESPPDAMVPNDGEVRFEPAPGDRGTQVTLSVSFDPPGGTVGKATLQRLDVVPAALVGEALRRFKSLAESGEIQTLEDNPSVRGKGDRL